MCCWLWSVLERLRDLQSPGSVLFTRFCATCVPHDNTSYVQWHHRRVAQPVCLSALTHTHTAPSHVLRHPERVSLRASSAAVSERVMCVASCNCCPCWCWCAAGCVLRHRGCAGVLQLAVCSMASRLLCTAASTHDSINVSWPPGVFLRPAGSAANRDSSLRCVGQAKLREGIVLPQLWSVWSHLMLQTCRYCKVVCGLVAVVQFGCC